MIEAGERRAPDRAAGFSDDRCVHSASLSPAFAGCSAYQPVTFLPLDSFNRPLASSITCRHLTPGTSSLGRARFYPRCALGDAAGRMQWLATATAERVDIVEVLLEDFERATRASRQLMLELKARALTGSGSAALEDSLRHAVDRFLAEADRFFRDHAERFDDAGLPVGPLGELVRDWVKAWMRSRSVEAARPDPERLRGLPAVVQAFVPPVHSDDAPARDRGRRRHPLGVGPSPEEEREVVRVNRPAASLTVSGNGELSGEVSAPGTLHIVRTATGIRLRGEIDALTVEWVEEQLESLARTADGDVEVDLGGVIFCDLRGIRALVHAASAMGPGGRLLLHGVPANVRRGMEVVGWAKLPGLAVAEAASPAPRPERGAADDRGPATAAAAGRTCLPDQPAPYWKGATAS